MKGLAASGLRRTHSFGALEFVHLSLRDRRVRHRRIAIAIATATTRPEQWEASTWMISIRQWMNILWHLRTSSVVDKLPLAIPKVNFVQILPLSDISLTHYLLLM